MKIDLAPIMNTIEAVPQEDYPVYGGADIRASWAGACGRQIAYRLRKTAETETVGYKSRLAFAVGHAIHGVVQDALTRLYPEGKAEAGAYAPLHHGSLGCHADYLLNGTVFEIKSVQTYAMQVAIEEGPQVHHLLQAGLCAWALGADEIVMIYVDKARGDMATWNWGRGEPEFGRIMAAADQELRRFDGILRTVHEGGLPAPEYPGRTHWRCRFCPFLTQCKRDGDDADGLPF